MNRGGLPEPFPYGIPTRKDQTESSLRKNEYAALDNSTASFRAGAGHYHESDELDDDVGGSSLFPTYGVAQSGHHSVRPEKDFTLGSMYQMSQLGSGSIYGSDATCVNGGAGGFGGFSQTNVGNSDRSRSASAIFQRSLSTPYNAPSSGSSLSTYNLSHGSSTGSHGTTNPAPNRSSTHSSSAFLSQAPPASGLLPGVSNMSAFRGGQPSANGRLASLATATSTATGGLPPSPYRGISRSTSHPGSANSVPSFSSMNGTSQDLDSSDFSTHSSRMPIGNLPPSLASRNFSLLSKPQGQEFTIHNEDFPALPNQGYKFQPGDSAPSSLMESRHSPSVFDSSVGMHNGGRITGSVPLEGGREIGSGRAGSVGVIGQKPTRSQESTSVMQRASLGSTQPVLVPERKPIQTLMNGTVSNIPVGMITDHFGLIGLLMFIRAADNNPNLVSLALGSDLKSFGLNLTSPDNLYSSFTSPFGEGPSRPQDIDYMVPKEYLNSMYIREKLAPIRLSRYADDLLFYLYCHSSGDFLQLAATAELYTRDWRYHMKEKQWIKKIPGVEPIEKTVLYERGLYYVFDVVRWRKAKREMQIWYDLLEERPQIAVQNPS